MDESDGSDGEYAVEKRRAKTYGLLGDLYHEPEQRRLRRLAETPPETVGLDVERLVEAADDAEALALDHAQLFVGPFELAAAPYESVYVDSEDRVMTESTDAVRAEYRRAGVDIGMDEPPDHVAAELEFVSLLVVTETEALAAGEFEAVEHYLRRQYGFLSEHLGRWISELAKEMRNNADTEFYRTLADETQRFVEADGRLLADRLDRLETTDESVTTTLENGPERPFGTTDSGERR